ncbi:MAG: EboA domain-containing protein [Bacteroidota bacterium]
MSVMFENLGQQLGNLAANNLQRDALKWLNGKLQHTLDEQSARALYLTYSLCNAKVPASPLKDFSEITDALKNYLIRHQADTLKIARIFLLHQVLVNTKAFIPAVQNLVQVADKQELETLLRYLCLLPNPEDFKFTAVEALRSNIVSVFEAIACQNPYPAQYFDDQQWNQMYLKAAFLQLDLSNILAIEKRANTKLARIISDYAHERWAASRAVSPLLWRPVSQFIDDSLLKDLHRLFESDNVNERRAAALVCDNSSSKRAKILLEGYPELKKQLVQENIDWCNFKA